MSTTPTRTRRRSIAAPASVSIPADIILLAIGFYAANQKSNAFGSLATADRKKLYARMKECELKDFKFDTTIEGSSVKLSAVVATPESTVIDTSLLRKIVDEETFMKIVSATKTSVEKYAGTEAVTRCGSIKKGTENVSVGPAK